MSVGIRLADGVGTLLKHAIVLKEKSVRSKCQQEDNGHHVSSPSAAQRTSHRWFIVRLPPFTLKGIK